MSKPLSDGGKVGKEAVDTGLKSVAALSIGTQAIAVAASDYLKRNAEDGAAAWKDLATARSWERVAEIQNRYARSAYEGFVAQATRLTELYADMAKEAFKPYQTALAKSR